MPRATLASRPEVRELIELARLGRQRTHFFREDDAALTAQYVVPVMSFIEGKELDDDPAASDNAPTP